MRLNSVYKHSFEIEKKITAFYVEIKIETQNLIIECNKILQSIDQKDKEKKQEINANIEKINRIIELLKQSYDKFIFLIKEIQQSNDVNQYLLKNCKDEHRKICTLSRMSLTTAVIILNKKMIESVGFSNKREEAIKLDLIVKNYEAKVGELDEYLMPRITNLLNLDYELIEQINSNNKSHLYNLFHREKKTITLKNNYLRIHVQSESKFEVEKIETYPYVMDYCNDKLSKEDTLESLKPRFKKIMSKNSRKIETEIIELIINTFLHILKKKPTLLRSNKTNIYVKIFPKSKRPNAAGNYVQSKSNNLNIFLELSFSTDYIDAYMKGYTYLLPNMYAYNTIVHELTHAYDYRLNENITQSKLVYKLLGEEAQPETVLLVNILHFFRSEGLAMISGFIESKINEQLGLLIFSFDELTRFHIYDNQQIATIFKFVTESKDVEEIEMINLKLNNLKEKGIGHQFGQYMALMIFINRLKNKIEFWQCKNDNMRVKIKNIITDYNQIDIQSIAQKNNWEKLTVSQIPKYLIEGKGLNCVINNSDYPKVHNFLAWLALLKTEDFFNQYLIACKNFGIDAYPLTPDNFKAINKEKKKQYQELLQQMGF